MSIRKSVSLHPHRDKNSIDYQSFNGKTRQKPVRNMKYKNLRSYCKGADWYVTYQYYNGAFFEEVKVRRGINRLRGEEKKQALVTLLNVVIEELEAGYNPLTGKFEKTRTEVGNLLINDALDFAYNKKLPDWTGETPGDRKNVVEALKRAILALDLNLQAKEIKRSYVMEILAQSQSMGKRGKGFGNRRYNAFKETFKTLFDTLMLWDDDLLNPVTGIKNKKADPQNVHAHPSDIELERISERLKDRHFPLYVVSKIILRTGTRPAEIKTIKEFHVLHNGFELRPLVENSKKKTRFVWCDPELMADINMILEGAKPGDYLFSKWVDKFPKGYVWGKPGKKLLGKNTFNKTWKKLVNAEEKEGGLGIKKTLYSLKGKGGDKYRDAGVSLSAVQFKMGHSSDSTTKIYLTDEDKRHEEEFRSVIIKF